MVATIKFSQFATASLNNSTNQIVGVTAPSGGTNFQLSFPFIWTTATRPSSPPAGLEGYNASLGQIEYWNGVAWVQLAAGGSGSVNVGAINELAWYAANGTAVSGLMTANNGVLLTSPSGTPVISAAVATSVLAANASGVPSWMTGLPSGLTINQPNIVGVTNGGNAAAGSVGEFITENVPYGSPVNVIPTGTPTDITSILLTAGDWDVWGNMQIFYTGNATTSASIWASTASASPPDPSSYNSITPDTNCGGNIPNLRVSVNTSTRVYLSIVANFSTGSAMCSGNISARRVR